MSDAQKADSRLKRGMLVVGRVLNGTRWKSNTLASALPMEPSLLVMSVALATTIGFMLPVATPPNAIVFGSGMLKVSDILKAGAILDVIAILVAVVLAMTLGPVRFGNL